MKRNFIYAILFLILAFQSCGHTKVNPEAALNNFLHQPTQENFDLWKMATGLFETCPMLDSLQSSRYLQLFKLVENGHELAFRTGLLLSRCFDGGELRDFLSSGGLFFDQNAILFIQTTKRLSVSFLQIEAMLLMLPLHTVDNPEKQISVLENRIRKLKALPEKEFGVATTRLAKSLQKNKESIETNATEMENSKSAIPKSK